MTKQNVIQVLKKRRGGKWYWRLVWSNGEVGAHSENYVRKSDAVKSAKKLLVTEFILDIK